MSNFTLHNVTALFRIILLSLLAGLISLEPRACLAHPPEDRETSHSSIELPTITVEGRSLSLLDEAESAGVGFVGREQFESRPLLRPGELLEVVAGMVVTQHSGDGKANQYFFRGFNLDHGTDFRSVVDGMPVNMRSHGHGQGYTDLNFIIPELIDYLEYKKGVYYAEEGDFATAGAAEFRFAKTLQEGIARLTVGQNDFYRAVVADSQQIGAGNILVGGEVFFYDGPWDRPNDVNKLNGILRYTLERGNQELSILALAYNNNWDSSDQIPQRAFEQGLVARLGNIDPDVGGQSERYSLSATWHRDGQDSKQEATFYGMYYGLDLFSNFTYFLDNPENGDEFEQVDKRIVIGGAFESSHSLESFDTPQTIDVGLQYRTDFIQELGLYNTNGRTRFNTVRDDRVDESSVGMFLKHQATWLPFFRTVSGIRGDFYWFDVESGTDGNSGNDFDGIASPKINLIFGPWHQTEFYLSGGFGFHSNDARGVTIQVDPGSGEPIDRVDPLAQAKGAEIGLRSEMIPGLHSTLAFWLLELESELVFVGDAGNTEASSESKRLGVELTNYYQPTEWLSIDLDYAFSRARFADEAEAGDRIPGALEHVLTSGISFDTAELSDEDSSFFGEFRIRYFAPYPLNEDNSTRADSSLLANVQAGYRYKNLEFSLAIFNLFDSNDNDIEYFYASRLPNEPEEGIEDRHFHPLEPLQLRATVALSF